MVCFMKWRDNAREGSHEGPCKRIGVRIMRQGLIRAYNTWVDNASELRRQRNLCDELLLGGSALGLYHV